MSATNANGAHPSAGEPDKHERTAAAPAPMAGQAPILIVDDTRDNLILLTSMLKPLGQPITIGQFPSSIAKVHHE